ncbi:hypothetical protein AWV79_35820 [Cupriavidus sp. UYMMa02A]|nr:hypothetical protein AWV79_35820 [Cupriavidus sp. UYMMa02A]
MRTRALAEAAAKVAAKPAPTESAAPAATAPNEPAPIVVKPTLASTFDVLQIRDADRARIAIQFAAAPKDLVIRDESGKAVLTTWDDSTKVISFPSVPRFTMTSGGKSVEVARVPGAAYEFPKENRAGLSLVFEKDGSTYLGFSKSVGRVSVFDEQHRSDGEQKDRGYKHNGIAQRLTVMVGKEVVHVDRLPQVRFYERPGKDAS